MCADVPNAPGAPTSILTSLDKIVIEWSPPSGAGIGTPVLGYKVYMQFGGAYVEIYDGQENSATRIIEVTQFDGNPFQVGIYKAYVVAFNWVGPSANGAIASFNVGSKTSEVHSPVTVDTTIQAAVVVNVQVEAKIDAATI